MTYPANQSPNRSNGQPGGEEHGQEYSQRFFGERPIPSLGSALSTLTVSVNPATKPLTRPKANAKISAKSATTTRVEDKMPPTNSRGRAPKFQRTSPHSEPKLSAATIKPV